MPLYDCLLLVKPLAKKEAVMDLVAPVGRRFYQRKGVITDFKSFGTVQLGYGIKKVDGRHYQVCELQLDVTRCLSTLKGISFAGSRLSYFPLSRFIVGLVAVLVLLHFEMNYFILPEIAKGNYGHFHNHPLRPPDICPLVERRSVMKIHSIRMLQKGMGNLL